MGLPDGVRIIARLLLGGTGTTFHFSPTRAVDPEPPGVSRVLSAFRIQNLMSQHGTDSLTIPRRETRAPGGGRPRYSLSGLARSDEGSKVRYSTERDPRGRYLRHL
jgi:hypothetical protein